MRVQADVVVSAPPEAVWAFVAEPERILHFMAGVTRWEVVSEQTRGVGARYRILMRVGSAEVGSLVEVVESVVNRDLAWTSITGVDQRARWRLRPLGPNRTRVQLRLAYGVAGSGVFGWLAEQVSRRQVEAHLRRTVAQLKRQVEQEQTRQAAARRREQRLASSS